MLLITLCAALITAVSALPSKTTSKYAHSHKIKIPYSVNCTSHKDQRLLKKTPEFYDLAVNEMAPLGGTQNFPNRAVWFHRLARAALNC